MSTAEAIAMPGRQLTKLDRLFHICRFFYDAGSTLAARKGI